MTGVTISQDSTIGIYLSSASPNPVSIAPNVTIGTTLEPAVGSQLNRYWTIVNAGTLISNGRRSYSDGIDLTSPSSAASVFGGGVVTNLSTGLIQGYQAGVYMASSGSLLNGGTISAMYQTHTVVSGGSVVRYAGYNYGGQSGQYVWQPLAGAVIMGGGVVSNASGGLITSDAEAVAISGGGTVQNAGEIVSTSSAYGFGVVLVQDGAVTNAATGAIIGGSAGVLTFGYTVAVSNAGLIEGQRLLGIGLNESGSVSNAATGTITGGRDGIYVFGTNAYVSNKGVVEGVSNDGVLVGDGTVSNAAPGLITGGSIGVAAGGYDTAINNHGTIIGVGNDGVSLGSGGYVSNFAGAMISGGADGIYTFLPQGTTFSLHLLNQGVIQGQGKEGVLAYGEAVITNAAGGSIIGGYDGLYVNGTTPVSIVNDGLIQGTSVAGAYLLGGGNITNQSGGLISSGAGGKYGVLIGIDAGVVVNAGSIAGVNAWAVYLRAGGDVTNQAGASITGGAYGVDIAGAGGSVQNSGSISGQVLYGILLQAGGDVTNTSGGYVYGGEWGVHINGSAGTIANAGEIVSASSDSGAGVMIGAGGTVSNLQGGTISSAWIGVRVGDSAAATSSVAYNDGLIVGSGRTDVGGELQVVGAGIWIDGPAVITNAAAGTITGGIYGIIAYNQTTLINQGSLYGVQYAFKAGSGFADRVIDFPTASFTGVLEGGNPFGSSIVSTLELAAGNTTGTIGNIGTVRNFGVVALDAGGTWSIGGSIAAGETIAFGGADTTLILTNPSLAAGATITGFGATDTIILAGLTNTTGLSLSPSGLLTVFESGLPGPILHFASPPALTYSQPNGGTDITVACFAEGTRIVVPDGAACVEDLRPGMRVRGARGGVREIIWIGHRRIDCVRHPRPSVVWPVLISADAFGPGLPSAPLRLSPDHAVFVNGVLIPVRLLVNGATIRVVPVADITYYHVELPDHDIVLAEDLPVESYLDIGDRSNFAGGMPIGLFPDFSTPAPNLAAVWEASGCAPLVVHGRALDEARAMLHRRVRRMA